MLGTHFLVLVFLLVVVNAETLFIDASTVPIIGNTTIITCDPSNDCSIQCDSDECLDAIIECPQLSNTSCSLTCEKSGCTHSLIIASNTTSLNIQCNSDDACTYLTVFAPEQRSDDASSVVTSLSITAVQGSSAATNMTLHATQTRSVDLRCNGGRSCAFLTLYGSDITDSSLIIVGGSANSVRDSMIYADNTDSISVRCESSYTCYNMQLNAVNAKQLIVDCSSKVESTCGNSIISATNAQSVSICCETCDNSDIDASFADTVSLKCTYNKACENVNLTCPASLDSKCSIGCTASRSCEELNIYQKNGFTGDESLYFYGSAAEGIKVYCGDTYSGYCVTTLDTMDVVNTTDIYCVSQTGICGFSPSPTQLPVDAPTDAPSHSPTVDTATIPPESEITTTSTQSPSGGGKKGSDSAAILMGILIPIGVIALGIIAYCVWKHIQQNEGDRPAQAAIKPWDGGGVAMAQRT